MSITVLSILSSLNDRINDSGDVKFFTVEKVSYLNGGGTIIQGMLHYSYLINEFGVYENKTVTSGYVSISDLDNDVVNGINGIIKVKITDGLWADFVNIKDVDNQDNSYLLGTSINPKWYVRADKIFIKPSNAAQLDILYLKVFTDMTASGNCPFNSSLKNLLITYAQAMCEIASGNFDKGQIILSTFYKQIVALNNLVEDK